MHPLLIIAAGGAVGAVTRFLVAETLYSSLGRAFPHATLFINVSGSFLMGFLTPLLMRLPLALEWRAALLVGFLGAYTTFSTFSIETITLLESGALLKGLFNIALSVALCLLACWLGLLAARALLDDNHPMLLTLPASLCYSLLVWLLVFVLTACYEWLSMTLNLTLTCRLSMALLLLGIGSTVSCGLMAQLLSPATQSLSALTGLFVLNGLGCALMLVAGNTSGQWLWALKANP